MSIIPALNLSQYGVQPADLNGTYPHIGDLHIVEWNNSVQSSNDGMLYETSDGEPRPPMGPPNLTVIKLQELVSALQLTYTPLVVLPGIILNIPLLFIIGFTSKWKKKSSVQYILAGICVDTVLLLNLGLIWLNNIGHRIYDVGALCHFTTFLGHLSNFLIPWYTLCLAVDLFVKLYHSSSAGKICSSLKAKVVILALCASGVAVFINESLMYSVIPITPAMLLCAPINKFIPTIKTMDQIDVFLNRLLPYTVTIVLLVLCLIRLLRPGASTSQATAFPSTIRGKTAVAIDNDGHIDNDIRTIVIIQIVVVLLLAVPSSGLRLYNTIISMQNPHARDMTMMLLHQVLEFIANARCAISILYILPISSTLRSQIAMWIVTLITLCKNRSEGVHSNNSSSIEPNGNACGSEPEEV